MYRVPKASPANPQETQTPGKSHRQRSGPQKG